MCSPQHAPFSPSHSVCPSQWALLSPSLSLLFTPPLSLPLTHSPSLSSPHSQPLPLSPSLTASPSLPLTSYTLVVVARDRGAEPRSSNTTVLVTVEDENDNTPVIENINSGVTTQEVVEVSGT